MGELFLYTLSKNGLEVWTLRSAAEGEEGDQPPPCIVTMQPLMYVQQTAIASDSTVLLLSKYGLHQELIITDLIDRISRSVTELAAPAAKASSKSKPVAVSASGRPSAASPPALPKLAIDDFVMISVR